MVVAQEIHKDGHLHLHAIVVLSLKTNYKDPRCLDIVFDGERYHGDYKAMKGKLMQAVKYCIKEDKTPYLLNIDLGELKRATESKKKYLGREVMAGKKLEDLVKANPECLFDFHNWQRSVHSYRLSTDQPYEAEGARGLWIWGPTRTGKSHYARSIS